VVDDTTPLPDTATNRPRRLLADPGEAVFPPASAVNPPASVDATPDETFYVSPVIPLADLGADSVPPPMPRQVVARPDVSPAAPAAGFLGRPPTELTTRQPVQFEPAAKLASLNDIPSRMAEMPAAETKPDEKAVNKPAKPGRRSKLPEPVLWVVEIAVWVVAALIVSTLLRILVVQLFVVPSSSMENTLQQNDRIAALKYAHFQRGDIVVFVDPGHWLTEPPPQISPIHRFFEKIGILASTDQQYLVKRVIGLPGDTVQCCSDGKLTINGVPIDESTYLKQPTDPASAFQFSVTVPAGRIFVMGDNRNNSADSRYHLCADDPAGFGMGAFVPEDKVIGPVRAVVLPFDRLGHRATPKSLFANVPAASGSPPAVASVTVTGGPYGSCQS